MLKHGKRYSVGARGFTEEREGGIVSSQAVAAKKRSNRTGRRRTRWARKATFRGGRRALGGGKQQRQAEGNKNGGAGRSRRVKLCRLHVDVAGVERHRLRGEGEGCEAAVNVRHSEAAGRSRVPVYWDEMLKRVVHRHRVRDCSVG